MLRRRELALIRRAKRGDAEAIEGLIKAHQVSLYHFMLQNDRPSRDRRGHRAGKRSYECFEAWHGLMRNIVSVRGSTRSLVDCGLMNTRSASRHSTAILSAVRRVQGPGPEELIQQYVDRETASDAVEAALSALSTRQQEIILLYYSCGCSIQEVALRQDLPLGTVKSHLFRARARMATVLEQSEFDMPEYSRGGQS